MEKYWSLYSGGKDSTAVTNWLSQQGLLEGIVTLDTGISVPDWLSWVDKKVGQWGCDLEVFKTPVDYDSLVLKYGFPGPGMHGVFMNYLKGRGVRLFKKAHPNWVLASGVRSDESRRRFRNTKEWGSFENVKIWAPLYDWTTPRVWEYVNSLGFKRSPAYAILCISGDCLCGAYADKLEREAIRAAYPELNARLEWLEARTDKPWGWGSNQRIIRQIKSPLCVDCESPDSLP